MNNEKVIDWANRFHDAVSVLVDVITELEGPLEPEVRTAYAADEAMRSGDRISKMAAVRRLKESLERGDYEPVAPLIFNRLNGELLMLGLGLLPAFNSTHLLLKSLGHDCSHSNGESGGDRPMFDEFIGL